MSLPLFALLQPYISIVLSGEIVQGYLFVTLIRPPSLFTNSMSHFSSAYLTVASHAGDFRGARVSSLPSNAGSTENNIPFPSLANHIVLSKFWKVDLDHRVTRNYSIYTTHKESFMTSNKC